MILKVNEKCFLMAHLCFFVVHDIDTLGIDRNH